MKKLLFILLLIPLFGLSQITAIRTADNETDKPYSTKLPTVFTFWKDYLADCNQLVPDTIKQPGVVNVKYVPVLVNGKISHYLLTPIDTVWTKIKCEECKTDDRGHFTLSNSSNSIWTGSNIILTGSGINYTSVEQIDNKINITRNKICHIKKHKASWDDFWNRWLVEKKIISLN